MHTGSAFRAAERFVISSTETEGVCISLCVLEFVLESLLLVVFFKKMPLQTKQSSHPFWDSQLLVNMNVCLHVLYCMSSVGLLVGRVKNVLLQVKSQEDDSKCCVFIGCMIHINNLAGLPYSPFILFSSLPLDIPVWFHSQNWAHCVQKATE